MKTDKLIDSLTNDLDPVRPVRPLRTCILVYALIALVMIASIVSFLGESAVSTDKLLSLRFIGEAGLLFIGGIMSIAAAFKLSVPDTKIRPSTIAFLAIPTLIVIGMNLYNYFQISGIGLEDEMIKHEAFRHEILYLFLLIALPVAAVFYIISKSAPTFRLWTGYAIVLSVASIAAIALRMFCPVDHGAHLVIYHYLPVMGASVIGVALGALALKW